MVLFEILIFFLIASLPFGQFLKFPLIFNRFPEIRIYLLDILVFLTSLLGFFLWIKSRKKFFNLFSNQVLLLGGVFLLSWLINIVNYPFKETAIGFLYLLRLFTYIFFGSILKKYFSRNSKLQDSFVYFFLIWCGLVLSSIGILQYLVYPDLRSLLAIGWDEHYFRLVSSTFDPNFTGILIGLSLLGLMISLQKKTKISIFERLLFLVFLASLLLTYSRGAYLSFIVGLFFAFYQLRKLKPFLLFLTVFGFMLILLPRPGGEGTRLERITSVSQRFISWQKAIYLWQTSPFFGIGYNNYRYTQKNHNSTVSENWLKSHSGAGTENSYLFVLATTGVFGLAGFLIFLKSYLGRDRLIVNWLGIFKSSGLLLILTSGLFINSLFYPWILVWLVILGAVS